MDLDTASPTGKLIINLLGSIAQFERELTLERQREGFLLQRRALASAGAAPAEVPAGLFLFDSSGARFSSSGPASSSLVRSYFSRT
jgi:hypothetical protein